MIGFERAMLQNKLAPCGTVVTAVCSLPQSTHYCWSSAVVVPCQARVVPHPPNTPDSGTTLQDITLLPHRDCRKYIMLSFLPPFCWDSIWQNKLYASRKALFNIANNFYWRQSENPQLYKVYCTINWDIDRRHLVDLEDWPKEWLEQKKPKTKKNRGQLSNLQSFYKNIFIKQWMFFLFTYILIWIQ